jgi:hypothetical protein
MPWRSSRGQHGGKGDALSGKRRRPPRKRREREREEGVTTCREDVRALSWRGGNIGGRDGRVSRRGAHGKKGTGLLLGRK